ncbi:MAG: ABC transporter ATP-binding protein [bacterium]
MNPLTRLLKYLFGFKAYLILAGFCMLINSLATIALPWMGKMLLDALPKKDISLIAFILALSIGIAFVLAISRYGQSLLLNLIGERVIFNIRCDVFNHLMDVSLGFYGKRKKGEILSRITNDVLILKNFLSEDILSLIKNPIVIIGSISILFYLNWKMTLLTLAITPLVIRVIYRAGKRMKDITLSCQRRLAELVGIASEDIHNVATIKLFTAEEKEKERFKKKNLEYFVLTRKTIRLLSLSIPLVELLGTIGIIVLSGYGGWQVITGGLTQGGLVAFLFYIGTISSPLKSITKTNLIINQAISAASHIFELLDTSPIIQEDKDALPLKIKEGRIEIKDVYFGYAETPVLSGVNLEIKQGEFLGIAGESGCGKTTLVNLILRLYEPQSGTITIDGVDIRKITIKSLRENIGFVSQEPALFSGTIAENIGYGLSSFSMDEIEKAASLSHCNFIKELPEGYNTEIGEYGTRLSAGQKQRIAIARALIMKPKILILDEATSNLDYSSEREIISSFSEILSLKTTLIVIAHRLSTIVNADRIVVMDEGKIAEMGSHKELMKKGGLYKRLYEAYGNSIC